MNSTVKFNLYDILKAQVQEGFQPGAEIANNLFLNIASLPPKHMEIVYVLIIHHYIITQNENLNKPLVLPYDGSVLPGGKGILLKQEQLPVPLIKIITIYLNKAHQSK